MPSRLNWPEEPVVGGQFAFALEDAHGDGGLVVLGRAEDLLPLGGDRRVALDELGHHAAEGFDAEGQRRDVEQQDVLHFAREDAALDRGADRDDFVRVDALVGLLAVNISLTTSCTLGMRVEPPTSTTSSIFARVELGVLERLADGAFHAFDQRVFQLFELRRG